MTTKIAFDLGATNLKWGIFEGNELISFNSHPLRKTTPEFVYAEINSIILDSKTKQKTVPISVPGQVVAGKIVNFPNMEGDWKGQDFSSICRKVVLRNDADCAADYLKNKYPINEGRWLSLCFGTGLGTTILENGRTIPNLDLGLIEYSDQPIERLISSSLNFPKSQFLENVRIILDKFSDLFATRNYIFSGGSIARYGITREDLDLDYNILIADDSERVPLLGSSLLV